MTNPYAGGQPDFTAIKDPVLRERYELGHHPRRTATELSQPQRPPAPTGWYRRNGKDLYRASEQLLYRVDEMDGQFQVVRMDLRPTSESYGVGSFGPQLKTWIGAKTLVEADAHEQMKGKR